MVFKMPKLHLAVLNDIKASESDARRFVHVVDGYAIVQNEIMCVVDLREYVKKECKITEKPDFDELTHILNWMDGKSFTKEYWEKLVKEQNVTLILEGLKIELLTFQNILEYEMILTDTDPMLMSLRDNINNVPFTIDTVAFKGAQISILDSIFKNEMKVDNYIFDFSGKDKPIRFSGQRKPYIFGMIPTDYSASVELMTFANMQEFKEKITKRLLD